MKEIIKNTILEFIRLKIVYIWIIVAFILIFWSYLLDWLTINQWNKAILDFSFSVVEIFSLITTLFLWAYLLYNEFSKKTVLLIISKIQNKSLFIISKFIWFAIIILCVYIILSLWLIFSLYLHEISIEYYYIQALFLSYLKILVVLSFLIFFSTFVSPFLALLSSLFIYMVSHATSFMIFFTKLDTQNLLNPILKWIIKIIYYVLPNFQDLSMKEYFLSPYLWNYTETHFVVSVIWWALVYIFLMLVMSSVIFNKKEF